MGSSGQDVHAGPAAVRDRAATRFGKGAVSGAASKDSSGAAAVGRLEGASELLCTWGRGPACGLGSEDGDPALLAPAPALATPQPPRTLPCKTQTCCCLTEPGSLWALGTRAFPGRHHHPVSHTHTPFWTVTRREADDNAPQTLKERGAERGWRMWYLPEGLQNCVCGWLTLKQGNGELLVWAFVYSLCGGEEARGLREGRGSEHKCSQRPLPRAPPQGWNAVNKNRCFQHELWGHSPGTAWRGPPSGR